MNKIRRFAEDLVTRYPSLFTSDFSKNKIALSQVSVIHARSIRNQLAGAITRIIHDRGSAEGETKELTLGEQIIAEVEREGQTPAEQPHIASDEKSPSTSDSRPQEKTPAAQ